VDTGGGEKGKEKGNQTRKRGTIVEARSERQRWRDTRRVDRVAQTKTQPTTTAEQYQREARKKTPTLKKLPRTAAVQITCPAGEAAETMRLARERIKLEEIGVRDLRPRRVRTGALLLEIPGADAPRLADTLAAKMREALADRPGVVITRPIKTAEIRVRDIEDSVSAEEIAAGMASAGGCEPTEVRLGPI